MRQYCPTRHEVHCGRGDHRKRVIWGHYTGPQLPSSVVQRLKGSEAWCIRAAQGVPGGDIRSGAWPIGHEWQGAVIDQQQARGSPLNNTPDLLSRQTPVDGVGNHTQSSAGPVQLKIGRMILRQNTEALALDQWQARQPGGQGIHACQEVTKGEMSLRMDDRRTITVNRGIP